MTRGSSEGVVQQRDHDAAIRVVRDHLEWHRTAHPRPTGGFPPEYFADELADAIADAIAAARVDAAHRARRAVHQEQEDRYFGARAPYERVAADERARADQWRAAAVTLGVALAATMIAMIVVGVTG